jgi:hypothetical protein
MRCSIVGSMEVIGLIVAGLSLTLSVATGWLTLFRRGTVRMAQPPSIFFGPDGGAERRPKVFVRALLYATSIRGHIVEGMFVRLHRGDSSQSFPVWVSGEDRGDLKRGAGLAVKSDGIALHHHFLLPRDRSTYQFHAGVYKVELFAVLIGRSRPLKLSAVELTVSEEQAVRLQEDSNSGLYFDWSPETGCYSSHLDQARPPDPPPSLFVLGPHSENLRHEPALPEAGLSTESQTKNRT